MNAGTAILRPDLRNTETREFEERLRSMIVGQEAGIAALVELYQTYCAGLNAANRPIGNLLFLGPTGTGKTRLVEAAAEILFGDSRAFLKVDCAEYQHSHEISKLIGSPPGYLGHRETHPLITEEALKVFHTEKLKLSFLLFDEIEKASDALWQLLLGIMDKATLTLGNNRRVDLSQTVIFLTSNLGGGQITNLMSDGFGFLRPGDKPAAKLDQQVETTAVEAARRTFSPEFMNRLDKIVVFRPLHREQLMEILEIELDCLQDRVLETLKGQFVFRLTRPAKDFLLQEGMDKRYGARHLKRAVERHVVHPLANLLATEQVKPGDRLCIDWDERVGRLVFWKEGAVPQLTVPTQTAIPSLPGHVPGGRAVAFPLPHNPGEHFMTNKKRDNVYDVPLPRVFLRNAIAWFALTLLIFVHPLRSQIAPFSALNGTISGDVIFEANGGPAAGAQVELRTLDGQFIASTHTDWRGRFQFTRLRVAAYVVSIELQGYERIEEPARQDGSPQEMVFHLRNDASLQAIAGDHVVSVRQLRIPGKAREALEKGSERLRKKDAAGSLAQFTRATTAFPGYYEAHYQMGIAHVVLGQTAEAERDFQKAIDLSEGRYPAAQFGFGLLLCQRQQFAEAEPIIRKGLELDTNSARGHYALARALLGQARIEEAESNARQAIFLNPALALAHVVLADMHLRRHDYSALLNDLDNYLKLEPDGTASAWAKQTREMIREAHSKSAETNDR